MQKRLRKWVMPIVATILLFSCWFSQDNLRHSYPEVSLIAFTILLKQPDSITCGPASTTMVLNRYGIDVELDEVKIKTKTEWFQYGRNPIGMTTPDFICSAMDSFGIPVKSKRGSIDELKYFISSGRPVIVLIRSGQTTWHYVVVVGYTKDAIVIANPSSGEIEMMKIENFMGSWNFTSNMKGVSIVPKCEFCKGDGKITDINVGPLTTCPLCEGRGILPDVLVSFLKLVEIYPKTMIVPVKSLTPTSK